MFSVPIERRHLVHFLAVVEEGSISGAARRLGLAQPSVSQAIRELEREVGPSLFQRRKGMRVTSAGRALIGPARRALRALDSAKAAVDRVGRLVTGEVDMAVVTGFAIHPLVPLLTAFHSEHPGVQIRIVDADPTGAGFALLDRGEVELLLHDHPPPIHGYHEVVLGSRRAVAVFPPDFGDLPDEVSLDHIAGLPLVAGPAPGQSMRVRINEMLAGRGLPPFRPVVETPHHQTILPLVLSGVCVAIVPEEEGALAEALGAVVRPLDFSFERSYAIYSRREVLSPAATELLRTAGALAPR